MHTNTNIALNMVSRTMTNFCIAILVLWSTNEAVEAVWLGMIYVNNI